MSSGFTLLWSKILDSSVWMESAGTRLVWITLLAMKNVEGNVLCSPKALAHRARVSQEEAAEALRVLSSPDPESGKKNDEGRRIREIPGGWFIINHDDYRFSTEAKREFWRSQKQEQREAAPKKLTRRQQALKARVDAQESRYVKAYERGASEEELDGIVDESAKSVSVEGERRP